ncbi:MAG: PEGA domain-containing protein [Proteobacteria bacterium]|nr:PEGA domain-containing protein [Pseudomonadota bacterium]
MKLNKIAGLALASICLFTTTEAFAETVSVMKLDELGSNVNKQTTALFEAIREQVSRAPNYDLDHNAGDITYTEMQMVTGCDRDAIACYDAACETLGSSSMIFGSVKDGGEAHVIWYVSGKGIFREVKGKITDKRAAEQIAQEIVVGAMGKLIVTSNIPGADVFIDGKRVGMTAEYEQSATPIELVTGNYVVAVRKDGYEKADAVKVTIEKGMTEKLHVDMEVATDPEAIRKGLKIAGWTTFGVGVAALLAGTMTQIWTSFSIKGSPEKDFKKKLEHHEPSGYKEIGKKADALYIADWVLFAGGGFLTAAGIALLCTGYLYDFSVNVEEAAYMPKVNFNLTPEYQGMSMGWSF